MIAVYLAPFYLLLNIFLACRIGKWLQSLHPFFEKNLVLLIYYILYAMLTLSPLGGAFGAGLLQKFCRILFNHWLGILMYLLMSLILLDLGTLVYRMIRKVPILTKPSLKTRRIRGWAVFLIVAVITVYGTSNAGNIKTKTYDVAIAKEAEPSELKIALIADLHLGANVGVTQVRKMVDIINGMDADLVVYAGDIFDNDYDAISDPDTVQELLGSISSTYGSYACWGNHDIAETILAGFTFHSSEPSEVSSDLRMDQLLKNAGITLLEDETVLIDNSFYLTGRVDASSESKSSFIRKTPKELLSGLDQTKPVIVIDHQPKELEDLAEAGADLTLSGHTHNGQNFPGNLVMPLIWENPCGMIQVGNMTDIVTSGVGIWGPAMRVGTDSEVVEVNVKFLQ